MSPIYQTTRAKKSSQKAQKTIDNALHKRELNQSSDISQHLAKGWLYDLKKRQRNLIRILTTTAILTKTAYDNSPTLSPILLQNTHATHNIALTKQSLQECFQSDTLYQTDDFETNIILDLMAGYADKKQFNIILKKYGYDSIVAINTISHTDPALYKTLWTMHQKYGNPHLTIGRAFKDVLTGKNNPEQAQFDGLSNTIYLHNLKDKKISFSDPTKPYYDDIFTTSQAKLPAISKKDRQRYLINTWIKELSHAVQQQREGAIRMGTKVATDELKAFYNPHTPRQNPGSNHHISHREGLYHDSSSYEFEAHNIIEPQLVQEFITQYESLVDTTNPSAQYQLGIFCNGYFSCYFDPKQAEKRLTQAANTTDKTYKTVNKYASFLLGNRYLYFTGLSVDKLDSLHQHMHEAYYCYPTTLDTPQFHPSNLYHKTSENLENQDTICINPINIDSSYIAQEHNTYLSYLHDAIKYYTASAQAGSAVAYYKLLQIHFHYRFPQNTQIGLKRARTFLNNQHTLEKTDQILDPLLLGHIYLYISLLYNQNNDFTLATKYQNLAYKNNPDLITPQESK